MDPRIRIRIRTRTRTKISWISNTVKNQVKILAKSDIQTVPVDLIPELRSSKPLGGVAVETDDVLAGGLRGEGELSLTAVHLRAESKTINPFSNVQTKHNPQNVKNINICIKL
jgi:hypothetical protein